MAEKRVLTYKGLKQYEDELQDLKLNRRQDVAQKLKEARAQGDLSENAEYDEAKNEQAQVEDRILVLEHMLINSKIIDESEIKTDIVVAGATVKLEDLSDNTIEQYTIVGSAESDPFKGKISNESPVGKACLGKKVGDEILVQTNGGTFNYKLLEIKR